jgi:hypothetical protein
MSEHTIEINYELNEEEVQEIIINELQDYIKLLHEFLSDPEHYEEKERKETIKNVKTLKAVLRMYMDRSDYKEFIEEVGK